MYEHYCPALSPLLSILHTTYYSLTDRQPPIQRNRGNLRYLDTIRSELESLVRLSGKTIQALGFHCLGDLLTLQTMIELQLAIMVLFVN